MKNCLGWMLSVSLISMTAASETETLASNEFSITGEFSTESELKVAATVLVSQEVLINTGVVEAVELSTGKFTDGEVLLSGRVDNPTLVTVTVSFNDYDAISTSAVVAPDDDLVFRVLQDEDETPNQLMFVGNLRLNESKSTKFTVSGNLSSLEADLNGTTVTVSGRGDGMVGTINYGSVLVAEDGTFKIENEIDEPRVVWIIVKNTKGLNSVSQTILEPQVSISVAPDKRGSELVILSDSDFHASLIESWAMNDEYLALDDAHRVALEEYQEEMAARQVAAMQAQEESSENETKEETTAETDGSGTVEHTQQDETKESPPILALSLGIPPIAGCEHVDLTRVKPGIMDYVESTYPEYFKLRNKKDQFRYRTLANIASTSEDPIEALLAIELDAFGIFSDEQYRALDVMDRLAPLLDEDLSLRRLEPLRSEMEPNVKLEINNRNLVPGQKAPTFTLPDLEGEDFSLQNVLEENDVVLVEFWASWCVPCIRKMPDLKKLHASYAEVGFQVLTINRDTNYDEWQEESEKHQFKWLNLGELKGERDTPVASSYGVLRLPTAYIIDKKGCVIQKDLRIDMLTEFLEEKYGEMPEEVDSESTDEHSG